MEVVLVDPPEGDVIARGSYAGGPDYDFVATAGGPVYIRVTGDGTPYGLVQTRFRSDGLLRLGIATETRLQFCRRSKLN